MREPGQSRYAVIGIVDHRAIATGGQGAAAVIVIGVRGEEAGGPRKRCKFTPDCGLWEGTCGVDLKALNPLR